MKIVQKGEEVVIEAEARRWPRVFKGRSGQFLFAKSRFSLEKSRGSKFSFRLIRCVYVGRAWPIEPSRESRVVARSELKVHEKEGGMQAEVGTNAESFNEFE